MERREPFMLGVLALVAAGCGLQLADVWPILIERLTPSLWIALALVHVAAAATLLALYVKIRRGHVPQRADILWAAATVVITWSVNLGVIARIASH